MKMATPTLDHELFRTDLIAVLDRHAGRLDSAEMLAIAAYSVGQMIAMMDCRKWNSDLIMELISKNIEAGNAHAIEDAGEWMGKA